MSPSRRYRTEGSGRGTVAAPAAAAQYPADKPVNKAKADAIQRDLNAKQRIYDRQSTTTCNTLLHGVLSGQLAVVKFERTRGGYRFHAESAESVLISPRERDSRTLQKPTPTRQRRKQTANVAASHCPRKPDVAQPSREVEATPQRHAHADQGVDNISDEMVRSVSHAAGVPSPFARAALEDTRGDVDAAADGLIRQQQEEEDSSVDQFTCASHIDSPGETPPMATGASSSSAAGQSEKDDKLAAGSKFPNLPRGASGKQPMSQIGHTDQLTGKTTRGRGRGRGGGGRGSGENRGGDGHRGDKSKTDRDNGPATRGGDG